MAKTVAELYRVLERGDSLADDELLLLGKSLAEAFWALLAFNAAEYRLIEADLLYKRRQVIGYANARNYNRPNGYQFSGKWMEMFPTT